MHFRLGTLQDLPALKSMIFKSWQAYQDVLSREYWGSLHETLTSDATYLRLFEKATCFLIEASNTALVGAAFVVPSGNPTDIYQVDWCQLRFVSVDPAYSRQGLGEALTRYCIHWAIQQQEHTMALHTSEIMDRARYIYEKIGFEQIREIDARLGVRYWLYTLDLPSITPLFHPPSLLNNKS